MDLVDFQFFANIVTKLDLVEEEQKRLIEGLELEKRYLKTTYKLHCKTSSICANHCAQFSLISPVDENFQVQCDHEHHVEYAQCHSLLLFLDEISSKVKNMKHGALKDEIEYDFNTASKHVMEYTRHIIRGNQQEKAKTAALE
ncbi:hypothetical protein AVEN_229985-1 [Araneus ventricosus]|uniref:Uncharacterized protein n=1 Tax=Araneus ventricosus TaxID=182803 RepID=A0A4Y2W620_ARAVE|nr:hypothetical protein AVEN_229985-1 [Araneus ventricosus]